MKRARSSSSSSSSRVSQTDREVSPEEAQAFLTREQKVYCVILTHPFLTESKAGKESVVILTTHPFRAVAMRNHRAVDFRDALKARAPFIYPEFVAGPFPEAAFPEGAMAFASRVVVGRRGLDSKVRHACELALKQNVPCYHIQQLPPAGVRRYLMDAGAPDEYLTTLATLKEAEHNLSKHLSHLLGPVSLES